MKVIDTRHVVWASIGFGAAMFVLAGAPTLPSAFPIALFVGLTSVAFITTSTAIVQVKADPAMRGRVLALQGMVLIGSTPIGGPAARVDLRHLRGAHRHPRRCGRRRRRGRLGLRHAPADRGVPRGRGDPSGRVGPLDVGLIAAPPP